MPLVCLSLTARTIVEGLAVLERYRGKVDLVELRADMLDPHEAFSIRDFPRKAGLPCILSVIRKSDGGNFIDGEGVRLVMIAKALSYARADRSANFAYVDLESDFRVPAIEEACRTFGTRIIRAYHDINGVPPDIDRVWSEISSAPDEIPKLAVTPRGAGDLAALLSWTYPLPVGERIIVGMGDYGMPSRILAERLGSSIAYTSALDAGLPEAAPGHLDPATLESVYRFREIGRGSAIFALGGGRNVAYARSPSLHNAAFRKANIDAVYLPIPSEDAASFMTALEASGARGGSVTYPFKEGVVRFLSYRSPEVEDIGAANTLLRTADGWAGYDTNSPAFERSLREFLGNKDLRGSRVTLVGAGATAKPIARVLAGLGVSGLVLNRTLAEAKALARKYGFAFGPLDDRSTELVSDHSDLIVQTTPVGMEGAVKGDPLDWYDFEGREAVFDVIYRPERTPLLKRAEAAGCRVMNGWAMLRYQAADQFRIWMGREPPDIYFE